MIWYKIANSHKGLSSPFLKMNESSDLALWLNDALQNENLSQITIKNTSSPGKVDGFIGGIYFVEVSAKKNNKTLSYKLVVKHGKKGDPRRKSGMVTVSFKREIFVYMTIFKSFRELELSEGVYNYFSAYPKCYHGLVYKDTEILVLDNLKDKGFELHDLENYMNWDHLSMVVKEYAKLHALSFAMRAKNPNQFDRLTKNLDNILGKFYKAIGLIKLMMQQLEEICRILDKYHENSLAEAVKKYRREDVEDIVYKQFHCEPYSVIAHSDNWNNNFLFKYKDDNKQSPEECVIIDFQMTHLSSPVRDISNFFYFNCDPESYDELIEPFLDLYHENLSKSLKDFGCDANELYPKDILFNHWKKYSILPYITNPFSFKIRLSNPGDIDEKADYAEMLNFKVKNHELYEKWVVCYTKHFVKNGLI